MASIVAAADPATSCSEGLVNEAIAEVLETKNLHGQGARKLEGDGGPEIERRLRLLYDLALWRRFARSRGLYSLQGPKDSEKNLETGRNEGYKAFYLSSWTSVATF